MGHILRGSPTSTVLRMNANLLASTANVARTGGNSESTVSAHGRAVLTIEQFAQCYGIGRTRAYAEIAAGRLKVMKFGRNTRIARTDADAWLEARRSEGGLRSQRAA
jgi:excisionase family DNA binding protein